MQMQMRMILISPRRFWVLARFLHVVYLWITLDLLTGELYIKQNNFVGNLVNWSYHCQNAAGGL